MEHNSISTGQPYLQVTATLRGFLHVTTLEAPNVIYDVVYGPCIVSSTGLFHIAEHSHTVGATFHIKLAVMLHLHSSGMHTATEDYCQSSCTV